MADETDKQPELLEFPCRFPIKVMGRDDADFRSTAVGIVSRHVGDIDERDIRIAPSSKGNFVSVTVVIDAQSQQQLDAIYQDLTANEDVLFSL